MQPDDSQRADLNQIVTVENCDRPPPKTGVLVDLVSRLAFVLVDDRRSETTDLHRRFLVGFLGGSTKGTAGGLSDVTLVAAGALFGVVEMTRLKPAAAGAVAVAGAAATISTVAAGAAGLV
ncbi:hypothetical protein LWI28_024101 [Acer negundo]|uniref:Uncharacterized protein n=1 Tax=Acer negundo TaxID=4023 RepID=A0AAD5J789_ACENE|nr:hypothetical protein LWI28_024101 [Acer negundo]